MKILNFGSCNIDYVYSLDHVVLVGETETTHSLEVFPGGKGLNQSIATARAGAKIYHAGCVGNDSDMLTDILKENGVDISFLLKIDEKNGHAIIQINKDGDNSIFLYPGSNEKVSKEYVDSVLENFEKGDFLLLQNEISNVDYIIEKAHSKKMCIILNPSPFNEKMKEIDFNDISYILVNEVEVKGISGCEDVEESLNFIRSRYPDLNVVLTLGSRGSIYADATGEIYQPAFCVDAVDTTAAGDTFTGYFVAGLASGAECKNILKLASAASAITVSRKGAAPSIPDKDEVLARIDTLSERKNNDRQVVLKKRIEDYIEAHLKDASIEELSKTLGYSAFYTGNLIKKLTGKPFTKMVQEKRCTIAADMLRNTDLSVNEIIDVVGYKNENFFRTIFKDKYGKSPLEYRKTSIR